MNIRQMVENRVWDEIKQEWITTAPKTHAAAVETKDGSTVQAKLDAIPGQVTAAKDNVIAEIRADVADGGNTLAKLHSLIISLQELVKSDDVNLDTVQEIADYIKNNRGDLTLLGQNKVNLTDIVNNLTTAATVEGKVLDARQGKVLKDTLDSLKTALDAVKTQAESFVTQGEAVTMLSSARPVINENAPVNPVNGQLWFKPAGTIEMND